MESIEIAAQNGYLRVLKYLHKNGIDLFVYGDNIFKEAIHGGSQMVVWIIFTKYNRLG